MASTTQVVAGWCEASAMHHQYWTAGGATLLPPHSQLGALPHAELCTVELRPLASCCLHSSCDVISHTSIVGLSSDYLDIHSMSPATELHGHWSESRSSTRCDAEEESALFTPHQNYTSWLQPFSTRQCHAKVPGLTGCDTAGPPTEASSGSLLSGLLSRFEQPTHLSAVVLLFAPPLGGVSPSPSSSPHLVGESAGCGSLPVSGSAGSIWGRAPSMSVTAPALLGVCDRADAPCAWEGESLGSSISSAFSFSSAFQSAISTAALCVRTSIGLLFTAIFQSAVISSCCPLLILLLVTPPVGAVSDSTDDSITMPSVVAATIAIVAAIIIIAIAAVHSRSGRRRTDRWSGEVPSPPPSPSDDDPDYVPEDDEEWGVDRIYEALEDEEMGHRKRQRSASSSPLLPTLPELPAELPDPDELVAAERTSLGPQAPPQPQGLDILLIGRRAPKPRRQPSARAPSAPRPQRQPSASSRARKEPVLSSAPSREDVAAAAVSSRREGWSSRTSSSGATGVQEKNGKFIVRHRSASHGTFASQSEAIAVREQVVSTAPPSSRHVALGIRHGAVRAAEDASDLATAAVVADSFIGDTAEQALPPSTPSESNGIELFLSGEGSSGYRGVTMKKPNRPDALSNWRAKHGQHVIGFYDTRIEAAEAFAKYVNSLSGRAIQSVVFHQKRKGDDPSTDDTPPVLEPPPMWRDYREDRAGYDRAKRAWLATQVPEAAYSEDEYLKAFKRATRNKDQDKEKRRARSSRSDDATTTAITTTAITTAAPDSTPDPPAARSAIAGSVLDMWRRLLRATAVANRDQLPPVSADTTVQAQPEDESEHVSVQAQPEDESEHDATLLLDGNGSGNGNGSSSGPSPLHAGLLTLLPGVMAPTAAAFHLGAAGVSGMAAIVMMFLVTLLRSAQATGSRSRHQFSAPAAGRFRILVILALLHVATAVGTPPPSSSSLRDQLAGIVAAFGMGAVLTQLGALDAEVAGVAHGDERATERVHPPQTETSSRHRSRLVEAASESRGIAAAAGMWQRLGRGVASLVDLGLLRQLHHAGHHLRVQMLSVSQWRLTVVDQDISVKFGAPFEPTTPDVTVHATADCASAARFMSTFICFLWHMRMKRRTSAMYTTGCERCRSARGQCTTCRSSARSRAVYQHRLCALAYSCASRGYWFAQSVTPFAWVDDDDMNAFLRGEYDGNDDDDMNDVDGDAFLPAWRTVSYPSWLHSLLLQRQEGAVDFVVEPTCTSVGPVVVESLSAVGPVVVESLSARLQRQPNEEGAPTSAFMRPSTTAGMSLPSNAETPPSPPPSPPLSAESPPSPSPSSRLLGDARRNTGTLPIVLRLSSFMQICDDDAPRWNAAPLTASEYVRLDAAVKRQLAPQQTQRSADHRRAVARRHAISSLLLSMNATTRLVIGFAFRSLQRARARIAEQVKRRCICRVLSHPLIARFVLMLRGRVRERQAVVQRTSGSPRVMGFDVSYCSSTGRFTFRSPQGHLTHQHPASCAAHAFIPAFVQGHAVAPLVPPPSSSVVLRPEASGAWCYYDVDSGVSTWAPPPGSAPLASMPQLSRLAQPISLPPPVEIAERLGLNSLRGTDWVPLFEDALNDVKLYNTRTGAIRDAPWIVLFTGSGQRLFINLVTSESRWFPPHRWMEGWVSRPSVRADRHIVTSPLSESALYSRYMLPLEIGRRRVDGGAPCMGASGRPQYPPDRLDDACTYPSLPPGLGFDCPDIGSGSDSESE
jgi:hypothetical protein